jgi:hypothetical protein
LSSLKLMMKFDCPAVLGISTFVMDKG